MSNVVNIIDGKLVNSFESQREIEQPAILIDSESGTCHGFGELKFIQAKQTVMAMAMTKANLPNKYVLIDLSSGDAEIAAYIINRCVLYTASGFQSKLCEKITEPDFMDWIKAEMARVKI